MNPPTNSDLQKLIRARQNSENDYFNRKDCVKFSKKVFKYIVFRLGLEEKTYNIRGNGDCAVKQDAILHADNFYINFSVMLPGGGNRFLFRTCQSQKDYSGGQNMYFNLPTNQTELEEIINKIKNICVLSQKKSNG